MRGKREKGKLEEEPEKGSIKERKDTLKRREKELGESEQKRERN